MGRARIEFKIGTKFYYDNHLIEVIEDKKISKNSKCFGCNNCFFNNQVINLSYCETVKCSDFARNDKKSIVFKEVEE